MKAASTSALSSHAKDVPVRVSGVTPSHSNGRPMATSIVLKTATDPKRQHAAIGKLMKMCRASAVVAQASRGITAEVRRDRERGHE